MFSEVWDRDLPPSCDATHNASSAKCTRCGTFIGLVSGGQVTRYGHPHPVLLDARGVFFEGTVERDRFICHWIMHTQAGEVSQLLFCPETVQPHHALLDQAKSKALIKEWDRYASPPEQAEKLDDLLLDTRTLFEDPRCTAAIHAVAQALIRESTLSGDQTLSLIRDSIAESAKRIADLPDRIPCPHCAEYDEFDF